MEPNKIPILDKEYNSSSSQTENTPKQKFIVCMDMDQQFNPNCSEQDTSNNDVKQYGDAYESQKTFLTRNMIELNQNSSSTFVLIKEGEKHTADAYNSNNESGENLPHFESAGNHTRDELTPDEPVCIASSSNSEINKLKDSLPKCTEMLPILAEDSLNHNGSEPKLPTENLCQAIDIRTYEIKAKAEEASSTTPEINEPETPEDITSIPAKNSASPRRRIILKLKRSKKKKGKNTQGNKKEAGVIIREFQESKNVIGIETESSILRASVNDTSTSESENYTSVPLENFKWGNYRNRNKQNETTNECVPSGEINTSQVLNESETETPVNSVNLNDTAMINNKNVESIKTSAQSDNANVVLGIRNLNKNVPNKSNATIPDVSILNPNKHQELISNVSKSVLQNEVNTNLSNFKSSQEDSSTNRESKHMSGYLIPSMKTTFQASIPPVINETQKYTSKEKICQEQTTENSENGESNQKDEITVERHNSCHSYADEQRVFYKDISGVGNVNAICDNTASSPDLNRETYISLNEGNIVVADSYDCFSSTNTNANLQPKFHNENLVYPKSPNTEKNAELFIYSDTPCEEKNDKADLIRVPVTPLISDSNTVTKTTLPAPFHDHKDLSTEKKAYPAILFNSRIEVTQVEVDSIGSLLTPLISASNTVTRSTLQASFQDENLEDQKDISAEKRTYFAIHFKPCSEDKKAEVDLNLISENEEIVSTSTLISAVDTSGKCHKVDSKTDFINQMDLNAEKENELSTDKENIEPDITCYNGNESIPTSQNSNIISRNGEPNTNSVTDSKGDTKSEVKTSNGNLDESSDKKVENITRSLLSNKKNVIDGYKDVVDFNINVLSNPDIGEVKFTDKDNENNEMSLQELEEIRTILENELPNKNLEITSNIESKIVTSQSDIMQSCNSLDLSENKIDDFKPPETRKEENLSQTIFCRTRYELPAAQEIYSSNENETKRELLEHTSNQNLYLNMNEYLTSNSLSDIGKLTVDNSISASKDYLCNEVVEYTGDTKCNPKKGDDNDKSEDFSKLKIQSGDALRIAFNENIPKQNSNENFHDCKIKALFQIDDRLIESNIIPILDKAFTSSSSQRENTPKQKSSVCMDTEQKLNSNCSEQDTSNKDLKQYGDANENQETFLTPKMKELKQNTSSSFVLIKEGEKQTAVAYNSNNESGENLPHFESAGNHTRDELKPDEPVCIASSSNSEINKLKDSLPKCAEMLPIVAEDALNRNGSEPKLPTENLCQAIDIRTETFYEIKAKAEEASSTTPEINEPETPEDITSIPANNSASPRRRFILKNKRRSMKVGKKRQGNKTEGGVMIGEMQGSENVIEIETESSKLRASEHEKSTSKSEIYTNVTWENFINYAWEGCTNINNQNETTNECVPSGENNASEVLNECKAEKLINSINLNGTERINSRHVESMKTSAENDDEKVLLSIRELDGNVPNKYIATMPVSSILNPKNMKYEELISDVTNSVPQNKVNTNLSIVESSQKDSNTGTESKQKSGDLISSIKTRSQAFIPPDINERQKSTSKEKICQEQTTENSEKGESNQKGQIKGERDNSCHSSADEQRKSYRDISCVGNVNGICDNTASSSDFNRKTYISLNERKILVADSYDCYSSTNKNANLQLPFPDENLVYQKSPFTEENAELVNHFESPCEEKKGKTDLIRGPVIPLKSESNTVTKTTPQASFTDENLEDPKDISAEKRTYFAIHSKPCSEDKKAEVDLNLISENEEIVSTSTLISAVDTSGKCHKVDSKTDFINQMDLNAEKEKELSIDKKNINPDITSMEDRKSEVRIRNGNLDESSGDQVKVVGRTLLSNKKNVIDGYNYDVDFLSLTKNVLSNQDVGGVKYIDKGNENNEINLQESEKIGTTLRSEIPNKSLEITCNNESKRLTSRKDRIQSCNTLDHSEKKVDDFKRSETRKEENLNQINFCQTRDELLAAQEIYSSNESETMQELLELKIKKNLYLNMNEYLTSNSLSDNERVTIENFISACKGYLGNGVVESMGDLKSNPKYDDDNDVSETFSKLNNQPVDTPSIACNENIPKLNSNENFHGCKIKGVFQIQDMEPNNIPILDKEFSSTGIKSETENTPKLKSRICMDTEEKITPTCSELTTSNNDVKQCGVAYESQKTFITRNMKEFTQNSSGSLILIQEEEKHIADAYNSNNELDENLSQFESSRNHMRDELKLGETICIATCCTAEMNKAKDTLSKCTEILPNLAEDALNDRRSDPKLPSKNLWLTQINTETYHEIKAKAEESWSTVPEINEYKSPQDLYLFTANNAASLAKRIIYRRFLKKVVKKRQENKKEGGVIIGELQGSENVDGIATESSILRASEHETSTSKSENFKNVTWESFKLENFTNYPLENFQGGNFTNYAWEKFTNRNNQNHTTNECVPSGEINTSQVLNESETETPNYSVNLNDMAMINNKNVKSIKTSAQSDNANAVLSTGELDGNVPNKSLATVVSILNRNKCEELISQVTNSVSQYEIDTNLSIFKLSQEDSNTNRESKQMSGDLISSIERGSQAFIAPVINETQINTSKQKICQEHITENSEKGVTNEKDQIKGERDNSCDLYADEQKKSYKDISSVRNVNANCDRIASSSDLNRETYISLNERKILVADSSEICNYLEDNNALDNISLDVTPHCNKEFLQNSICKRDEIFTDGGRNDFGNTTSFFTSSDNFQQSNKSASRKYIKRKGQIKIRYTDDSAAVNDETGKENVNSEENCDKKWNTEITRKKDKRYVFLQKFRGIVAGEESNTGICEIERYESQASYGSSCEKLSMTQETTSLKMVDKRNSHSENVRKPHCNEFSEKYGFEQESGAKNKEIQEWISSISSPEESSTLSDRPPTGSSENENFRLHPSTSVSNSNTTKSAKKYSKLSVDSPVCTSFLEEEQSNYDDELYVQECQLKKISNTFNGKEKGTTKLKRNLCCKCRKKCCRKHRQVNDGRSTTNERLDLERESIPLNFHLKCDNLDIRFLDSQSNFTLRFVKESENESHPVPKNRNFFKSLTHSDCTDEILLPTDTSSLHDGHFSPTHPLDIPKISNIGNTLQISAERLPTNLDHQNASTRDKVFSFDNFLTKHANSREFNESAVLKTINDKKSCPYTISEVNKMSTISSSNQGHNDKRPSEDSEYHQKADIASTSNGSKIKPDANVSALDPELKNSEKSNDFILESEIMKINYIPYSNSESISISYRRHRNDSKLTFKSQEKKLYLKTSKSSVETDFE